MKVWILMVGEPMAVDEGSERKVRMALIADEMLARGCEVTWWTSSFDHNHKRQRYTEDTQVRISERFLLYFLY